MRTLQAGSGYINIDEDKALYYATPEAQPLPVQQKKGLFGEINFEGDCFCVQFSKDEKYLRTIYLGQDNDSEVHVTKADESQTKLTYTPKKKRTKTPLSSLSKATEKKKDGAVKTSVFEDGVLKTQTVLTAEGAKKEIVFADNGLNKVAETTVENGITKTVQFNEVTGQEKQGTANLSAHLAQGAGQENFTAKTEENTQGQSAQKDVQRDLALKKLRGTER